MLGRNVICLAFIVASSGLAAAQPLPVPSSWQNQRGSTLSISSIDSFGNFRGTYINRASGFGCQNSPYPVVGYTSGSTVNFVVTWNNNVMNCLSVTAWNGAINGATLTTYWQLGAGNPNNGQVSISYGQDYFQRIAAGARGSKARR